MFYAEAAAKAAWSKTMAILADPPRSRNYVESSDLAK